MRNLTPRHQPGSSLARLARADHVTHIREEDAGQGITEYRAECRCGWVSPDGCLGLPDANARADEHIAEEIGLIKGATYKIRHRAEGQGFDRMSVMRYLGRHHCGTSELFDARPHAGTQEVPHAWIVSVERVADGTDPYCNRRWPVAAGTTTTETGRYPRS